MAGSRRATASWALVLAVVVSWALALVLAAAGLAPSTTSPPSGGGAAAGSPAGGGGDGPAVVLVGIPGLTWDVVDEDTMPTLARLAREGDSAALVLRGAHEVTCAADAWLTLGSGQRASTDVVGCGDATSSPDRPATVLEDAVDDEGRVDPVVWQRWRDVAARRALGGEPGALAQLLERGGTCASATGAAAALAAAGPGGAAGSADACRVRLVSLPPVDAAGAAQTDAAVARVVEDLPDDASLLVAGLGHTAGRAEATALVLHPAGGGSPGALTSGTTRQRGLVQLTDLTPTLTGLAGVPVPAGTSPAPAGQPVSPVADDDPVQGARDLAAGVGLAKAAAPWVLGALAALTLPLLLLAAARRRARAVALLATFAMAVPVATFLAGLAPWWRAGSPVLVLTLVVAGLAALVAAPAWAGPWRREPLGPPAVVAALTLVVLGVDTIWSARLGLVSVLGVQPVTAGRFYGQGNVGFGVVLGAFLVLAWVVLARVGARQDVIGPGTDDDGAPAGSRSAALAVLVLGLATTVLGAASWAGADFGSVPSLVVATGLLVLAGLGRRWSLRRLVLLGTAAVVVAAGVMVLDWSRGAGRRTHLGDFVQSALEGEAFGIVARKLAQSLNILVSYPLSWLAVLALVLVVVVVVRRPAWSAPLWRHRGAGPVWVAGVVAIALAWALNDSGIAVVALALTLLIATAVSLLARDAEEAVAG